MVVTWDRNDSAWLRNILSQPSGRKLVDALRTFVPRIKAVNKETAWIQAVEKQGAEDIIDKFLSLATLQEPELQEVEGIDLTKEGD